MIIQVIHVILIIQEIQKIHLHQILQVKYNF